ncbi:hypothetical protein Asi02nite_49190 [Asanoa siamensis]|uniref:Uncharacterized protein n=1 Tax=Asanoa siamensis TaxID=926357 RepID=A0ABQ4CVT0_9ACTN|nr:hypothetical protein Asi02nite_49190 [Asanoa siamensis]
MKVAQTPLENSSGAPAGVLESRINTVPTASATSTQAPEAHRLLLRQEMAALDSFNVACLSIKKVM